MIRKLLKLVGVGVVSGAACRMGSMLADALFPGGLGGLLSRFNKPREEDDQPKRSNLPVRRRG